ncbi:hypothetical protein TNCV_2303031 [Trichonephila clavipes]|nr:hypothetical protein TNCV_2303031 [Trichonephila clavipes]
MNRCPDLVVCLKRDLQCLRPEASLVLIYRPNVAGMKGRVDLAQPVNRTPDLCCGSTTRSPLESLEIRFASCLFYNMTSETVESLCCGCRRFGNPTFVYGLPMRPCIHIQWYLQ